jgi:hypothetical protein
MQKLPGVVHQDRDVLALARRALDRILVGNIELDGDDAVRRLRNEMSRGADPARADVDALRAGAHECADECFADAAIAACHERYGVGDFHLLTLFAERNRRREYLSPRRRGRKTNPKKEIPSLSSLAPWRLGESNFFSL